MLFANENNAAKLANEIISFIAGRIT